MFKIKSIYFYFLALKINLSNYFIRFYFRSKKYKNSLKSKIPQGFFFYPNPFVLSSLTNNKNFQFNLHIANTDTFWKNIRTRKDFDMIHSFAWLNFINRKEDGVLLRKIIANWIIENKEYKDQVWLLSTTSKRVLNWLFNAEIILNSVNRTFKRDFYETLILQINHIKKNLKSESDQSRRIELISALIVSGVVFKECSENYESGVRELKKSCDLYFDDFGFPLDKNIANLLKYSKYLIIIKECIKEAQKNVPEFVDELSEKINCNLKNVLAPNNKLPLFNGVVEVDLTNYLNYLKNLKYNFSQKKKLSQELKKIKNKNINIFFERIAPPKINFSNYYQSGPLSFEYYLNEAKVITNSGFGSNISNKATLLSRLTSSQSTLCLNDLSVTKLERSKIINSAFGYSIKERFKVYDFIDTNDENHITVGATHNAYEKKFGTLFKRSLKLNKRTNNLIGLDELSINSPKNKISYCLRFHLYPGINAVKTIGGNSILIQITKNKSLLFVTNNNEIQIEKGIFLGGNKILNNLSISLSGILNENKKIEWEIKQKI